MSQQLLLVDRGWDGEKLEHPAAELCLRAQAGELELSWSAPMHHDPPPPSLGGVPGRYPELWKYEVVECFLLGDDDHYLELEWNPHGHWLAIRLEGERNFVTDQIALDTEIRADAQRWSGVTRLSADHLPPGLKRVNAFAIHGLGAERRYCAHVGGPGDKPDFHRLELFASLDAGLLRTLGSCGAAWR
jgi:hypothetical protein